MLPYNDQFVSKLFQFLFSVYCHIVQFFHGLIGRWVFDGIPIVRETGGTTVEHTTCTKINNINPQLIRN